MSEHAWPYLLCRRVGRGNPKRGLLEVLGLIWFIGLGFAALGHIVDVYTRTETVYLLFACIAIVSVSVIWADEALLELKDIVPPAYVERDRAEALLNTAYSRIQSRVPLGIAAFVLAGFAYVTWNKTSTGDHSLLPSEWYKSHRHWTAVILIWYGLASFSLIATVVNAAIHIARLVWKLRTLRIAHPFAASIYRLRSIVQIGQRAGLCWTLASIPILYVVVPAITRDETGRVWLHFHSIAVGHHNIIAIGVALALTWWALLLFLLPLVCIGRAVNRDVRHAIYDLDEAYPLNLVSRGDSRRYAHDVTTSALAQQCDALVEAWARISLLDTSPLNLASFLTQILFAWLPFAAAFWR